MTGSAPSFLTIAEAGRLIAAKRLSPVELVKDLLARIEARNPELNAFLLVTERQALAAARAAERAVMAGRRAPLLGIPVAYKDIYETAGVRTTAHSRILADNVPKQDAETVRRLHAEGAVMLGKLATHEFAIGGPAFDLPWPPARNPWDTRRFTGGSSSGSGAAVAAGSRAGCAGVGHRRFDPPAGSLLRHRRHQADAGTGVASRRDPAGAQPGHRGSDGLDGTGLRHPARCPGWPRSGRSGLGARAAGILRCRDRRAAARVAGRTAPPVLRARRAGIARDAAHDEPRGGDAARARLPGGGCGAAGGAGIQRGRVG